MGRRHDDRSATAPAVPVPPAMAATPTSRRELRELEGRGRRPSARPRRPLARRIGAQLLSLGAMVCAAALLVGVSIPASLFGGASSATAEAEPAALAIASAAGGDQHLDVSSAAAPAALARDAYTSVSWAQVLQERYASRDYTYAVGSGAIRWPFPYAVPISDGFGERAAPCRGCSSMHYGVDFLPGVGAPIFAIADGVVTQHDEDDNGFGNSVVITHVIDGKVTSTYAHMQAGSSPLQVGQSVVVGEFVGLVGSTGAATGPHLHLEVAVEGVKIDPFTWLKAHAS